MKTTARFAVLLLALPILTLRAADDTPKTIAASLQPFVERHALAGAVTLVADKDKVDPDVAVLMAAGPLPDIVVGSADAPNTIVEYASMTCPHCAQFQTEVFPQLKTKYIDTGKVRYMLREFPLDNLAAAAFMLARCAGNDRYYPMVDAMFSTQESWAAPGVDCRMQVIHGRRNWQPWKVLGTSPDYLKVRDWADLEQGEPFTDGDVNRAAAVCLMGQTPLRAPAAERELAGHY